MALSGKKILVGITGGIAAYKICELVRLLIKLNATVKVIMTSSAKEFVTETTFQTLTHQQVYCDQFNFENWKPEHICLADEADLFILAPASANTIGKIANGICDNLLTSVIVAFKKPIIIAPAMNCNMWENKFVQKNITNLVNAGFYLLPPEKGELACGYSGSGRLCSIEKIKNKAVEVLTYKPILKGKRVIVTAGGTKESIDPVRYIGNHSSGKMGIAIADTAHSFGAEVVLISTVKTEKKYTVLNVNSASEMLKAVSEEFHYSDVLIMTAAVADYQVENPQLQKIKKNKTQSLTLNLVKNQDILKEMSKVKRDNQVLIGFSAESENVLDYAKKKLKEKNLDYIIANDISKSEIGFNSDYNAVTLISKDERIMSFEKAEKNIIAKLLLNQIFGKGIY